MADGSARAEGPTGLVLQGGGARGAYQIGVLKAIAEITGARHSPFPIISGTSVGAINAAPLAVWSPSFQRGVRHLERLWRGLHCSSVFRTDPWAVMSSGARWLITLTLGGLGVGNPCSLLDNSPLERLLRTEYKPDGVRAAVRAGALRALCITASSYSSGQSITFYQGADDILEWDRARRHGRRARIEVDHLMASSALPFMFPAVPLENGYFGDGALRLTAPLSPAIRMGARRLLVIGGRDDQNDAGPTEPSYPTIGEMAGHALDILFNDNLDADHERLSRINKTVRLLPQEALDQTDLRVIETLMLEPSRDLREIAVQYADEVPGTIKLLMRSIGSWGQEGRLSSYLLFEPGYVGALVDLGYSDTLDRAEEVREFLAPSHDPADQAPKAG